ncbi:hypothetical protein BH10PSE15_BH10PSE15_14240 [soil metagenome]
MAYEGERSDPTLAMCRDLELNFDGKKLIFSVGDKVYTYPAVSGVATDDGTFDYSPARQRLSSVGPIPEGIYWINPAQMWTNGWHKIGSRASWGNHRVTIHPFTTTETFGRGGFFIHGGDTPGSKGCIDLVGIMDRFVRDLLNEAGSGQNCQIHLTVRYPVAGDYVAPRGDLVTA